MTKKKANPNEHLFPVGNRIWEKVSSVGRKPKFKNPAQLRKSCFEYFDMIEENPLFECKVGWCEGKATKTSVPKMRAMTLRGLCVFLDIGTNGWRVYKKKNDAFKAVIKEVEDIIYDQKFTGAAGNMLNANIIARDLGLKDVSEVRSLDLNNMTTEQLLAYGLELDDASDKFNQS